MSNGNRKTRLELTWIGKENRPRLEPRILLGELARRCHARHRVNPDPPKGAAGPEVGDLFDKRLTLGDNLLVLSALNHKFTGKIKCIQVDPPYNTGSELTHYDLR